MAERPFQWAAIKLRWTRRHLAALHDRLGRGSINPVKKWWVDIEMIDGTPVEPPRGANAWQLDLGKKTRDTAGFAMFARGIAPPGPHGMAPFPLDRQAGVEASRSAERPADAQCRR